MRKEYSYYTADVFLNKLLVDTSYQRDINRHWLKKIVNNYNPALVRQLVLSERKNGDLYVIDGNHTSKATIAVFGPSAHLPAKIYTNLTVEEEAVLFNSLNSNSKRVRYGERLRARVRGGDQEAINYISALNKSGIDWKYTGGGKNGPYEAHQEGESHFHTYGEDIFTTAMTILRNTENHTIYVGYVVGGICYLLKNIPTIDQDRLAKTLVNANDKDIKAKIALYGTSHNGLSNARDRAAAKTILEDYYNRRLRKNNHITLPAA